MPAHFKTMWIAKKKFRDYEAGDEVKEEDAKRVGTLYCTKSNDTNISIEVTIDDKETKASDSDTEDNLTSNDIPVKEPIETKSKKKK